jgi:hypothetical protein
MREGEKGKEKKNVEWSDLKSARKRRASGKDNSCNAPSTIEHLAIRRIPIKVRHYLHDV